MDVLFVVEVKVSVHSESNCLPPTNEDHLAYYQSNVHFRLFPRVLIVSLETIHPFRI